MAKFSATQARVSNRVAIDHMRLSLKGLGQASLKRVVSRTLAGAKRRFEPAAKRIIRESYNVKARDLAGKFSVRTGADTGGEFIGLAAETKGIPLIAFGGRWRGVNTPGATAQVTRGAAKTYQSAFIATINGTRRMLARQLVRGGGGKRDPRNKLRSLLGPSPSQMVDGIGSSNARAIADEVNGFISNELERQIALSRTGK